MPETVDLNALQTAAFGSVTERSACFYPANFVLDCADGDRLSLLDLPMLHTLTVGEWSFSDSLHTVITSGRGSWG